MDVSSVQSSAKGSSSDFSIKRILSNEAINQKNPNVIPNWLCCTRYQPPRLPRTINTGCRARRSGRHARVPFTVAQASALEAAYARAPYLAPPALRALAAALQLRDDRIKIWFQNRRARERREKTATITPPHEITLPPTGVIHQQRNMTSARPWISHTNTELQSNSTSSHNYNHIRDTSESPQDLTISTSTNSSVHCSDSEDNDLLDVETVED